MKKIDIKRFDLKNLFYKEKFVIVLSIVLAFVIWLVISLSVFLREPDGKRITLVIQIPF